MIRQQFEVKKDNGNIIRGIAYIPDGDNKKFPAAIYAHGLWCNYRQLEHHGPGFSDSGIACFFFDFCGGSADSLSDGEILDLTVLTEVSDMLDVLEYVSGLEYIDKERITLMGESMGGYVAAYVAGLIPDRINSLVLWYPAFVIQDHAIENYAIGKRTCLSIPVGEDFYRVSKDIDIYEHAKKFKKKVTIIHGDRDVFVPIRYTYRAIEEYDNARMILIKDGEHGFEGEDSRYARECSINAILEE